MLISSIESIISSGNKRENVFNKPNEWLLELEIIRMLGHIKKKS